jgi:hypothetical protein
LFPSVCFLMLLFPIDLNSVKVKNFTLAEPHSSALGEFDFRFLDYPIVSPSWKVKRALMLGICYENACAGFLLDSFVNGCIHSGWLPRNVRKGMEKEVLHFMSSSCFGVSEF